MRYLIFPILLTLFFSCKNETPINPDLLGHWTGTEWLREGKPLDADASQVHFTFNADGTFEAKFGAQTEAGIFNMEGDKLYTKAEGQLRKMVKIQKLSADTLQFQMNRTGTEEVMVLVK